MRVVKVKTAAGYYKVDLPLNVFGAMVRRFWKRIHDEDYRRIVDGINPLSAAVERANTRASNIRLFSNVDP